MSSIVQKMIEKKLRVAFNPDVLDVVNENHLHVGHHHDGMQSLGESSRAHFRIKIVSRFFSGMRKIDCHRAVNHVLKDELNSCIHALAIEVKAPDKKG